MKMSRWLLPVCVAFSVGLAQEVGPTYGTSIAPNLEDTSYSSDGAKFVLAFCTVWTMGFGVPGVPMACHENAGMKTFGLALCLIAALPSAVLAGMVYSDWSKGKRD